MCDDGMRIGDKAKVQYVESVWGLVTGMRISRISGNSSKMVREWEITLEDYSDTRWVTDDDIISYERHTN